MNKENCALKLVDEIILAFIFVYALENIVDFLSPIFTELNKYSPEIYSGRYSAFNQHRTMHVGNESRNSFTFGNKNTSFAQQNFMKFIKNHELL